MAGESEEEDARTAKVLALIINFAIYFAAGGEYEEEGDLILYFYEKDKGRGRSVGPEGELPNLLQRALEETGLRCPLYWYGGGIYAAKCKSRYIVFEVEERPGESIVEVWLKRIRVQTAPPQATAPPTRCRRSSVRPERRYRRASRKGATYSIAVCLTCRRIVDATSVRDVRVERGKVRGKLIYRHEHPLHFITLVETRHGNRSVKFDGELLIRAPQLKQVERAWKRGRSLKSVRKLVKKLL